MANKYYRAFKGFQKLFKPSATKKTDIPTTIIGVQPGKNLAKKRKVQDDIIKTREKVMTDYGVTNPEKRTKIRKASNQSKINKKISNILEKKATGGRVGRRFGGDTMKKKTNVQKIKETFGPKKNLKPVDKKKNPGLSKLPTKVRNNMGYMKSGGRAGFKGGGADTGRIGQLRSDLAIAKNTADNKAALKKADQDRNKFDKVAKADFRDRNK